MQTILGAGGPIGVELAKALLSFTSKIRLVSRNPGKVNPTDELMSANLLNAEEVNNAVKGSTIVYATIGFPYDTKIWSENWPIFITYVINACKAHGSKLVFFDNIYMYDPNCLDGMTENTPINPSSKKGKVRARIVQMIMDEVNTGSLKALIARSADFYGPNIKNTSMLVETVFKPLSQGKKANWMGVVKYKHSFTYTPDAGKATAILGNTEDAYNQVWHLPTASNPPTGKEWVNAIAHGMGVKPRIQAAPKFVVRIIGVLVPIMGELVEMMYQYDRAYVFNSDKFEKRFNFKPTPYAEGIKNVIASDFSGN